MHATAMKHGKLFFETYLGDTTGLKIMDLGAQDVNGSLRSVAPPGNEYVGVDFCDARGVDVVIDDPYKLPFKDGEFDVCVSSSCFEHSEFFWLTFLEIVRVTNERGLIYLNMPSNGPFHRYPVDCWRFYPDSGAALSRWAARNGTPITLLESFVADNDGDHWNDLVAVFSKSTSPESTRPRRMLDSIHTFRNGLRAENGPLLNESFLDENESGIFARVRRRLRAMR